MRWLTLFNKLGKQPINVTSQKNVVVLVDNKEIKITGIKFKVDGSPYLTTE